MQKFIINVLFIIFIIVLAKNQAYGSVYDLQTLKGLKDQYLTPTEIKDYENKRNFKFLQTNIEENIEEDNTVSTENVENNSDESSLTENTDSNGNCSSGQC